MLHRLVRDSLSSFAESCLALANTGHPLQSWPTLLHLYSRFKAGKTVDIWIEENGVSESGIDVRRFVTFGVIKGFLRRIHRWPVLLPKITPKRGKKSNEPGTEGGESETPPNPGTLAAELSGNSSYEEPSLLMKSSQTSSMVSFSPTTPTATSLLSQASAFAQEQKYDYC